jgi:hypothetical protein
MALLHGQADEVEVMACKYAFRWVLLLAYYY